jgi:adenine-specific DNA-methyltransferase
MVIGKTLRFKRYLGDFPVSPFDSVWEDTAISGFGRKKQYVVETNTKVIERCMIMTTDPGDLVLDPTCGSGSTAYVAEQWGRRWITIDTSRVAIAIARQRMLTSKFDRYRIMGEDQNGVADGVQPNGKGASPHPGFLYKTVPHVTLKSIAQNQNLDPIFARHEPVLNERLAACNVALGKVTKDVRDKLLVKLVTKERAEGKKAVTDADRRRWELPRSMGVPPMSPTGVSPVEGKKKHGQDAHATRGQDARATWEHWEVPFDTDTDWPKALQDAVTEYRKAWRAKMDEVNACIAANAEPEELVDQPEVVRGVVRVTGPFTVEAVQPPEMSLGEAGIVAAGAGDGAFDGEPELPGATFEVQPVEAFADTQNIPAYLDKMIRLLKTDAVTFPNNKVMKFSRLEPVYQENATGLHAEGRWMPPGQDDPDPEGEANVCVVFGPQYGPVTAMQVEEAVRAANRAGYEALVLAGFSFDGAASAVLDEYETGKLKRGCLVHMAHIRPDVNPGMDGLLKEQPGSQLFTVFGQPRTRVEGPDAEGNYIAHMDGVDIYNPVENSVTPTGAAKVAAWFIDGDYDGRTFCITQAFFPDRSAWDKLARALKGVVDEDRFEALSGTTSLPFPAGKHKRVAVKVIDPRGNEVMRVHRLEKA